MNAPINSALRLMCTADVAITAGAT